MCWPTSDMILVSSAISSVAGSSTLNERLDQSILRELAVLVVIIGWPSPLDNPDYSVAVAKSRARQPDSTAQVLAGDLSVLADPQRRPPGHVCLLVRPT